MKKDVGVLYCINIMYHVVKQFVKIGHKVQLIVIQSVVIAQSAIFIKYIFQKAFINA